MMVNPDTKDGLGANKTKLVANRSGLGSESTLARQLVQVQAKDGFGANFKQVFQMIAKEDRLEAFLQALGRVWVQI